MKSSSSGGSGSGSGVGGTRRTAGDNPRSAPGIGRTVPRLKESPIGLPRLVVNPGVPRPQQQNISGLRQLPHAPVFVTPEHIPASRTLPKPPTKPPSLLNAHPKNRTSVFIEDFRLSAGEVYERPGGFYNLDDPVIKERSGGTPPTPTVGELFPTLDRQKHKTSTRGVTDGHGRALHPTFGVTSVGKAAPLLKYWKGETEGITAERVGDASLALSTLAESPSEPKRVFHQKQS